MTQEDKNLLLQDLCARLPYDVKVQYLTGGNDKTYVCNVDQVSIKSQCVGIAEIEHTVFTWRTIDRIKPYLRPMSSMTEEEKHYIDNRWGADNYGDIITYSSYEGGMSTVELADIIGFQDWLLANHFDFRNLIEKGLAIEVTQENNPYKD